MSFNQDPFSLNADLNTEEDDVFNINSDLDSASNFDAFTLDGQSKKNERVKVPVQTNEVVQKETYPYVASSFDGVKKLEPVKIDPTEFFNQEIERQKQGKPPIEFISDEDLSKTSQFSTLPLNEKLQLIEDMKTQREFEGGIAATRGLTLGVSKLVEPPVNFKVLDEEGQKVYEELGMGVSALPLLGPANQLTAQIPKIAPFLSRMLAAGSVGGLQEFTMELFDADQEIDADKIAERAIKFALLDGALQAAGKGFEFFRNVNKISNTFGASKAKAFKFVWDEAGSRGMSMTGFADEASQWASLAEEMAQAAESGTIELIVPDKTPVERPLLDQPAIEAEAEFIATPEEAAPVTETMQQMTAEEAVNADILSIKRTKDIIKDLTNKSNLTPKDQKTLAFNKYRLRQLEKRYSKDVVDSVKTEEPEGFSEELQEEILPEEESEPEVSQEENEMLNDSEVDGYFQDALMKDGFSQELDKFWNRFNVERPFQKMGAPETGFQVKNYYSNLTAQELKTIEAIKELSDFTPDERQELALLSEQKTPPTDPKMRRGYDVVRNYFDETFQSLKEAGVLTNPFPESYILRLENENKILTQRHNRKGIGQSERESILEEIKSNKELISELKETKFVNIPFRLWFEQNLDLNKPQTQRVLRLFNQKKRKIPTIRGLIESGAVKAEDVDIAEIMAYYGRRTARDIGLGKILKSAETEGLSSKDKKPGYVKLPSYQYPAIKDYYIHPKFADWLTTYVNPKQMGTFSRFNRMVKNFSFYNPVILPFNDIVQQLMATGVKGATNWKAAFNDVKNKTPEYWEAFENGLFSQPYNMFTDTYRNQWVNALSENKGLDNKAYRLMFSEDVLGDMMEVSSEIAWAADRMIRMATYRTLLQRGHSPREAAQLSALFHGDYAAVDPATRKVLNNIFFTPTFKIVMAKLYKEMLSSPVKIGEQIYSGREVSQAEKTKMQGLLGTLAVILAIDQLYTNGFGFEREEWGRKYSKKVTDDEGVERNLNVTLSNPANLFVKFYWRAVESFAPGNTSAFKNLVQKNKYEFTPVIRTAYDFFENKRPDGEPIYNNYGDSSLEKLEKSLVYATESLFPLYNEFAGQGFADPEALEAYDKEVGDLFSKIPGSYVYYGPEKERIARAKMMQIQREFRMRAKKAAQKNQKLTEEEVQVYKNQMRQIRENAS